MPVISNAFILAEDDFFIIENLKISSKNVIGFKMFYDMTDENSDSFHYAFRFVFEGSDIENFLQIKNGLTSNENIEWVNEQQKVSVILTVKDATVAYDDNTMNKKKKQILDVITYFESDDLK